MFFDGPTDFGFLARADVKLLSFNSEEEIFYEESVRGNLKSFNFQLTFRTLPDEPIRRKQTARSFYNFMQL